MILRYFVVAIYWLFVTLNVGVNAFEHVRRDLSIADIPACGLQCLFRNMPKNSCQLDDFECICNQRETIQAVSSCMVNNCTMADNLVTARVNRKLCNLSDESKSGEIITYTTVVYAVAFSCVALRIAGKLVSRKLAWNDVPIVVAVILTTLPIALIYIMTMLGFGEHIWNLEDGRLLPILRYFYICRSSYIIILGLIKISLVLFYLEIFTSRRFRQISWAIFGYIVVHSTVIFILTIVPCTPVEAFWDRDLLLGSGKCMDIQIVSYTNSVSSILQDLMLMVLPMFFIKNLQMKRHRKLALVSMFSLGGFGCIATLIRLHTLLKFKISFDPTWDYASIVIWTELEITAAFLCVSLPSIRVLVMRFIPWTSSDWRPSTSRHTNTNIKSSKNREKKQPGMAPPPPDGWKEAVTWTTITSNEAGIAKPKKSLSVNSRTPIIPHSQYARRKESVRSNHSDSKAAVERSPFQEPGPITIPESKFAIKESSAKKYAHRQSRNSRGLYDGTDITALPSIGCLPERTFSKERIDRK